MSEAKDQNQSHPIEEKEISQVDRLEKKLDEILSILRILFKVDVE